MLLLEANKNKNIATIIPIVRIAYQPKDMKEKLK